MIFEIKSDLPVATQNKIDYIEAITSAQRTTAQAAFLTALTPYRTNTIISVDENGLIIAASGLTVPTGYEGFAKGATFTKTDATGAGLYNNTGTSTSAVWSLVADTDSNAVAEATVANAVAASKVLTVADTPAEGETVSMGGVTYKFRAAIGAGTAAARVLTLTGLPSNTQTLTLDTRVLTFKTALTEKAAFGTLTLDANVSDSDDVTIGTTVYKFTTNLSTPAVPFEVKIGTAATDTIDNLIAAINAAAGAGTTYATGTTAHPDVTAAAGAGDTMVVTAKVKGVAGNSIATTEDGSHTAWGAGTLASGANAVVNEILIADTAEHQIDYVVAAMNHTSGEGTTYSTGTVAHTTLDITKSAADTLTATAKTVGFAGNSIVIGETMGNATWASAATTLTGGVDAESANDVLIGENAQAAIDNLVLAVTAGETEGTNYGTGTVVNPLVTAAKASASTMTCTALVKGTGGNSIAIAETLANGASVWAAGATTLSGGTAGTVGAKGDLKFDTTNLYVCTAANTVNDANWKKLVLQTI